jgi:hypothetical protein
MPLEEVLGWDDYGSWGEFSKGELAKLPPDEAKEELSRYRGGSWADRALAWLKAKKIPPIVLVDGKEARCIGDGRGRVNFAMAFNKSPLDVIILKEDPRGKLPFDVEDGHLKKGASSPQEKRLVSRVVARFLGQRNPCNSIG